uniref:Cell division cycle associated 3 n=1 Tax=Rhinolophus ferrumequinum TaxID=59479 RepID=A0A671DQJ9_RHIFE
MDSAKSIPVTPVHPLPHNKLLCEGQTRVESSPQPNLPAREQLEGPNQAQGSDPGSPTLGIAWTHMKTSSGDPSPLVKQLSEVFETETPKLNPPPQPVLHLEAPLSSESDVPLGTQFSLEDQTPPWSQTELLSKQVFSEEETGQPSENPFGTQDMVRPKKEHPRSHR